MELSLQEAADITFIALTVWREARGETSEAKLAVAFSIMNRVQRPSWWGRDVQSVLFRKWQYSSLTAPNDPQLAVWPKDSNDPMWKDCLGQAANACSEVASGVNPMPGADSYYDVSIPAPYWTKTARFCGQIGKLKFYDVDHDYEGAEAHLA